MATEREAVISPPVLSIAHQNVPSVPAAKTMTDSTKPL